jgi:CubicO group peptidase (beta-lactamase class C family)
MTLMWQRALLLLLLMPVGRAGGEKEPAPESLDAAVEEIRVRHRQPAIAAAVSRADRIVAIGAAGVRREGSKQKVAVKDRFHVGSCAKSMTAAVLALVVEDGKLSWDAPLAEIFPEFEKSMDPAYRRVTLEQLLHHRAGVPSFTSPTPEGDAILKGLAGKPSEQRRRFAEKVLAGKPALEPDTRMEYSNAGYSIAASVAEKVSGKPWETLLAERLFKPLGMASAGFGWPAARNRPAEPLGHMAGPKGLAPQGPDAEYKLPPALAPAGDVHCAVEDFARYAQLHLRGLRGQDGILKSATILKLHEPVDGYAMGWLPIEIDGAKGSWHNGSAGTFFAWMTIFPEENLAIVAVTNAGSGEEACKQATETLLERFRPR